MFAMFLSTEVGSFPWGAVYHRGLEKHEAGVPGTDRGRLAAAVQWWWWVVSTYKSGILGKLWWSA